MRRNGSAYARGSTHFRLEVDQISPVKGRRSSTRSSHASPIRTWIDKYTGSTVVFDELRVSRARVRMRSSEHSRVYSHAFKGAMCRLNQPTMTKRFELSIWLRRRNQIARAIENASSSIEFESSKLLRPNKHSHSLVSTEIPRASPILSE